MKRANYPLILPEIDNIQTTSDPDPDPAPEKMALPVSEQLDALAPESAFPAEPTTEPMESTPTTDNDGTSSSYKDILLPDHTRRGWTLAAYADPAPAGPFALDALYKYDPRGKLIVWQVQFDGGLGAARAGARTGHGASLWMYHGTVEGIISRSSIDVVTNTSGRTLQEQAWLEAKARWWKKWHTGYTETGDEAKVADPRPQLAAKWEPGKTKLHYPVLVQEKIDGVRLIGRTTIGPDGEPDVELITRTNRSFAHFAHIRAELLRLMRHLPPGTNIDGELWAEGLSLQQITSITGTRTKAEHPDMHRLNYHIFDLQLPTVTTDDRVALLTQAYNAYYDELETEAMASLQQYLRPLGAVLPPDLVRYMGRAIAPTAVHTYLRVVPSHYAESQDDILEKHGVFVAAGLEGIMIRASAASAAPKEMTMYSAGRNKRLLKYKEFQDAEGTIIDVEAARGAQEGCAVFVVEEADGTVFRCMMGQGMTLEARRQQYADRDQLIGQPLTFRYQDRTGQGVPRFPVGVAIRNYE